MLSFFPFDGLESSELERLVQGHTATQWRSRECNPGLNLERILLTVLLSQV